MRFSDWVMVIWFVIVMFTIIIILKEKNKNNKGERKND